MTSKVIRWTKRHTTLLPPQNSHFNLSSSSHPTGNMADPFAVPTRKTSPPSNPSTPSTKTHNNRTPSAKAHKNNKTPSSKSKKSSTKHSNRKPNKSRKKIAFLFLVRRTLNQLAAWEEFFNGPMGKTHSTIYCHPKEQLKCDR